MRSLEQLVTLYVLFKLLTEETLSTPQKDQTKVAKSSEIQTQLKAHRMISAGPTKVLSSLMHKGHHEGEVGSYILLFAGPIEEDQKEAVRQVGVRLIEYLPDFSFLVMMNQEMVSLVKKLPFIVDVELYHPLYKLHPALFDDSGQLRQQGELVVRVSSLETDSAGLNLKLTAVGGEGLYEKRGKVIARLRGDRLAELARQNEVKYIEEVPEYILLNDVAKGYMAVDDLWELGYHGAGQVVGISDTGLDTGRADQSMHADFQGRIKAIYALGRETADDPHGHGTHVAGSVLGDGTRSDGQIKGMAPQAELVFQSVLDPQGGLGGLPADLNLLFQQAWEDGARIHTNSWGAALNGEYNSDAQDVDEFIWNHDLIVLFAAGNEGEGVEGQTVSNSISSPGTAKNCITVGASENDRPLQDEYADDPSQIAVFSSRGWTDDGRYKPDIVAPGTWILSTRSSLAPDYYFWGTYNEYYAYMGGTSMATPLVAGAVAVAREYLEKEWGITPSPALMKALIINGGTDLGLGFPSPDQGWGRINLMDSLVTKKYQYDDETTPLSTGEVQYYSYSVESADTPLRISLVWTDYPGSPITSKSLVNDLDLIVTSPTGTVYYGNNFTEPFDAQLDRRNNVENVYIDQPEVGMYTVQVKGFNVPSGPQLYAIFASGDFVSIEDDQPSDDLEAPSC